MDARSSFKSSFLAGCIASGHASMEQIAAVLEKAGAWYNPLDWGGKALGLAGTAIGGAKDVGLTAAAIGLTAPPLLGYMGGQLAGRAVNTLDDFSAEDARRQELIETYRRQAARLRQLRTARRRSAEAPLTF